MGNIIIGCRKTLMGKSFGVEANFKQQNELDYSRLKHTDRTPSHLAGCQRGGGRIKSGCDSVGFCCSTHLTRRMLSPEDMTKDRWIWWNKKLEEAKHPRNPYKPNPSPLIPLIKGVDIKMSRINNELSQGKTTLEKTLIQIQIEKSKYRSQVQDLLNQYVITETDFEVAIRFFDF